jgi:ribosome maturation factor RimP
VLEAVRRVAERVTSARGYELVDLEVKPERGRRLVRLYVDREGGVGLDELQAISEEVSTILDVEDPIPTGYTLEVSSPGLDRPLKNAADYQRFVGRLARVWAGEPIEGRRQWTGRILGLEEGVLRIRLELEGGAEAAIPFEAISHGRLEVEMPGRQGAGPRSKGPRRGDSHRSRA